MRDGSIERGDEVQEEQSHIRVLVVQVSEGQMYHRCDGVEGRVVMKDFVLMGKMVSNEMIKSLKTV